MPFSSNVDLPKAIKDVLPDEAQTILRNVVNSQLGDGKSDEVAFASAWGALSRQGWEKNSDGKWTKIEKFSALVKFKSFDTEKRQVFGWASIVKTKDGEVIKDTQNDVITVDELEKGAYTFVKTSRVAGEMHEKIGVGTLVESMVFTKEKQEALGIAKGTMPEGWWVGFEVDGDVFEKVKSGEYSAFSIGGTGKRKMIED